LTTLPTLDISPDEKRCVTERVLRSQTFSRSDQLRRFLQYICEKDIEGKADEINEYSIAVEALGRQWCLSRMCTPSLSAAEMWS